jgi:hypothetical protein
LNWVAIGAVEQIIGAGAVVVSLALASTFLKTMEDNHYQFLNGTLDQDV